MKFPDFDQLAGAFPDYWKYPKPEMVKELVGGGANSKDITNTCAIRTSYAMNGVGVLIPRVWETIVNRQGTNRKFHIIRVARFRTWMEYTFGKPDYDFQKKAGTAFDRKKLKGRRGVIVFDIGFGDATGHSDLWYKDTFSHEYNAGKDYFTLASRITLWSDGIITLSPEV